jgi:putative membrane protein
MSKTDDLSQSDSTRSVFLRGVLMGVAELVPGVSGGTIAFISGVYYRLIGALASFGPVSLTLLRQPTRFWHHHQLSFLMVLAAGMGVGILVFARVIGFMLEVAAPVLWAFFFGVIVVSVYQIGVERHLRNLAVFGSAGVVLGFAFLSLPPQDFSGSLVALFFAGMVAVCAWILPGISGSFVLLLLGLYTDVIAAVNSVDLLFLAVLACGCASGLLLFTRVLGWLLNRYHDALLALLTGFMATALVKLWPWQAYGGDQEPNSNGFLSYLRWPHDYALSGAEAFLLLAVLAGCMGGLSVWLLSKFAQR